MADKKTPKKDDPANEPDDKKPADDKAAKPDDKQDPPAAKTYTEAELEAERKKWQKEADKKIKDAEDKAKLSEDERKDRELKEAQDALRERDTRDAVTEAASSAGVKNPRLFYNAYKSELEFDDAGKIKNLKDVLETAKTEAAELFTSVEKPAGGADGGEGNGKSGVLTKEAIDKMSPKEIADNMEAIDAFMAAQQ